MKPSGGSVRYGLDVEPVSYHEPPQGVTRDPEERRCLVDRGRLRDRGENCETLELFEVEGREFGCGHLRTHEGRDTGEPAQGFSAAG